MSGRNRRSYWHHLWDSIEGLLVLGVLGVLITYTALKALAPGLFATITAHLRIIEIFYFTTIRPALLSREAAILLGIFMAIGGLFVFVAGAWIFWRLGKELWRRLS